MFKQNAACRLGQKYTNRTKAELHAYLEDMDYIFGEDGFLVRTFKEWITTECIKCFGQIDYWIKDTVECEKGKNTPYTI